jgi:thymidylate synthase (FAD)
MLDKYYKEFGAKTFAEKKKARETAREFLPNMTETKIVVTMNLRGWLEMLSKRNSEAADGQIRAVASKIKAELVSLAPNVFSD